MTPKLEANPTQEREFLVEDDAKSDPHMPTHATEGTSPNPIPTKDLSRHPSR